MIDGRIDFAVHSLKDLPSELPPGVTLAAIGEREDARDALVSDGRRLDQLPTGARIGTSSLRRHAQLRHHFPALQPVPIRGNVDTRLRKLDSGECDAILLAAAGLKRLGYTDRIAQYLDVERMLPAVGQGALAMVCRARDTDTLDLVGGLDDPASRSAVTAERALLEDLEGSCQIPIGGYACLEGHRLRLDGLVASPDGERVVRDRILGEAARAGELGVELGGRLRRAGGEAILDAIRLHGN